MKIEILEKLELEKFKYISDIQNGDNEYNNDLIIDIETRMYIDKNNKENYQILSIAAVNRTQRIHTPIKPQYEVSKEVLESVGYSEKDFKHAPDRKLIMSFFRLIALTHNLHIWNADRDLQHLPEIQNLPIRVTCLMKRFSNLLNIKKWQSLSDALNYFEIDYNPNVVHTAIGDAYHTHLLKEKIDTYEFIKQKIENGSMLDFPEKRHK